jgi:hypothetical protein
MVYVPSDDDESLDGTDDDDDEDEKMDCPICIGLVRADQPRKAFLVRQLLCANCFVIAVPPAQVLQSSSSSKKTKRLSEKKTKKKKADNKSASAKAEGDSTVEAAANSSSSGSTTPSSKSSIKLSITSTSKEKEKPKERRSKDSRRFSEMRFKERRSKAKTDDALASSYSTKRNLLIKQKSGLVKRKDGKVTMSSASGFERKILEEESDSRKGDVKNSLFKFLDNDAEQESPSSDEGSIQSAKSAFF